MIGAVNVHPYKARHNQLDMALIHIEAELALSVCSDEFGLIKRTIRFLIIHQINDTHLYQLVKVIMT